jgi:hypothetical protein
LVGQGGICRYAGNGVGVGRRFRNQGGEDAGRYSWTVFAVDTDDDSPAGGEPSCGGASDLHRSFPSTMVRGILCLTGWALHGTRR